MINVYRYSKAVLNKCKQQMVTNGKGGKMKRILPTWCKEVKKSMIDDDINVTELAERVGFSRNYVSGVVNGRVYAPEIAKVIGEDRHVTVPYTDTVI